MKVYLRKYTLGADLGIRSSWLHPSKDYLCKIEATNLPECRRSSVTGEMAVIWWDICVDNFTAHPFFQVPGYQCTGEW